MLFKFHFQHIKFQLLYPYKNLTLVSGIDTENLVLVSGTHCKYLNARSECNDIVISVYSHYPLDPNAKSSDTKCVTLTIR